MSGTLVFSHANSFPASVYQQLFDIWRAAGWRVLALEKFGHDSRYPVRSNWSPSRDELLAFIQREAPDQRVHLVGHSLGGFLSFLAACKKPQAVASVVLLDSPLIGGWRAHGVQVFKATGLMKRVSPGKVSKKRRWQWPDDNALREHFENKTSFARWAPEVLSDYLRHGFENDPATGDWHLAFRREVETRFYNTLPHHMEGLVRRHPPRCPVSFIGGSRSVEMRQVGMDLTRRVTRGRITLIEGSHLFPMEQPVLTANTVLDLLASHVRLGSVLAQA